MNTTLKKHFDLLLKFGARFPNSFYQYCECQVCAIENAEEVEGKIGSAFYWKKIKNKAEVFRFKLKANFPNENREVIYNVADFYEQYLIYDSMFPNSENNPFKPIYELIKEHDCLISIKFGLNSVAEMVVTKKENTSYTETISYDYDTKTTKVVLTPTSR